MVLTNLKTITDHLKKNYYLFELLVFFLILQNPSMFNRLFKKAIYTSKSLYEQALKKFRKKPIKLLCSGSFSFVPLSEKTVKKPAESRRHTVSQH